MADDVATRWEAAYRRFETPADEVRKFRRRLRAFGAEAWPRDLPVVELFCGRGNGLHAWSQLGFTNLTGIDLSPRLIAQVDPVFPTIVADARQLPLADASVSVISVHGGLHHLPRIPEDLQTVLAECRRVLQPGGRLLLVEPWETPFLRLVHWCCRRRWLRHAWPKLDALAEMIELEAATYFAWLRQPDLILRELQSRFPPDRCLQSWGKLSYLATRPD